MLISRLLLLNLAILSSFVLSASAFGAGTIAAVSAIKGTNFRHGDIEETLLTLAIARCVSGVSGVGSAEPAAAAHALFTDLETKRVYFGNWLRDYSQAIDVGTLRYVGADAIRMLVWVLGFLAFGRGTDGFEVTRDRLGCYRPAEHIDNPRGYANGEDARVYDPRLRPPVDEEVELAVDGRTGLKNYISTEDAGIPNSATTLRDFFTQSIACGRQYAATKQPSDLHEALRHLGAGLHILEDFAAHSNYVELSLIELGEASVFPFVGRNTGVSVAGTVRGARDRENETAVVYPVVTGTFGEKDFLHSVLGELTDWATQVKIKSLGMGQHNTNTTSSSSSASHLFALFQRFPGQLDGEDEEEAMEAFEEQGFRAAAEYRDVSPRDPSRWQSFLAHAKQTIVPIMAWNDHVRQQTRDLARRATLAPDTLDTLRLETSSFILAVLSPWILPIMRHVRAGLEAASREIIAHDKQQQLRVFFDDTASDPTHSMLAKDHFANPLNEPAGRVARVVLAWTVPQIMQAWDDPEVNVTRLLNRVIYGVFHHPALREYDQDGAGKVRRGMFRAVRRWWGEKDEAEKEELRYKLSREGLLSGEDGGYGGDGCGESQSEARTKEFLTNPVETMAVVDGNVAEDEVLIQASQPTGEYRPSGFRPSAAPGPETTAATTATTQHAPGYLPFYAHPSYGQSAVEQYDYEALMYDRTSQAAASRGQSTINPTTEAAAETRAEADPAHRSPSHANTAAAAAAAAAATAASAAVPVRPRAARLGFTLPEPQAPPPPPPPPPQATTEEAARGLYGDTTTATIPAHGHGLGHGHPGDHPFVNEPYAPPNVPHSPREAGAAGHAPGPAMAPPLSPLPTIVSYGEDEAETSTLFQPESSQQDYQDQNQGEGQPQLQPQSQPRSPA